MALGTHRRPCGVGEQRSIRSFVDLCWFVPGTVTNAGIRGAARTPTRTPETSREARCDPRRRNRFAQRITKEAKEESESASVIHRGNESLGESPLRKHSRSAAKGCAEYHDVPDPPKSP